ncbi:ABC transporter substrate-binding protein [uncultured Psychroserpens sp.]|uniref:ABC transporter substrate-binding protein n=1 Tax=uncultured Psychroserpens sp. TaxID=255436 RepID=UPI002616E735|nr:helical backbone metal receptor [uncultured Psychroserpens sp.]
MKYLDQLQRTIELKKTPKRIVSLVPSQTELLVDLGLEFFIVGVTKFCVHPSDLRQKTNVVGGTKKVNYDKIIALHPDIILCNKEENTKDMISELESIAPVHISDIYNIEDALELINMYGKLFSVEEKSAIITQNIVSAKNDFSKYTENRPKLKVAYFIWKDPWMVAAQETFIDEMISLNGFENYFENLKRYPEIDIEALDDSLDAVLLSSEPFPFNESHVASLAQKLKNTKIIVVDGEYFSWYGSRLQNAFDYFKKLHQDL